MHLNESTEIQRQHKNPENIRIKQYIILQETQMQMIADFPSRKKKRPAL